MKRREMHIALSRLVHNINMILQEIGDEEVDCFSGSSFCEHGNETSHSIQDAEFLDQLNEY
jgi:hypothetical protein